VVPAFDRLGGTVDWSNVKNHYGNIASVVGLVVSVLGFSFTLWQVKKSRTAAERAQVIAREAIDRVSSRLFFTQIATAVRHVQEVLSFCRALDWHRAIDRCEQLRIVLAGAVDDSRLQGDERGGVTAAIDDLLLIMRHLEGIGQGKKSAMVPPRMMETLDKIVISLTRIDSRLRRTEMEVKNGK
jgi:hypothetical protein